MGIKSVAISAPLPLVEEAKSCIERLGAVYHQRVGASTDVLCTTHHRLRYVDLEALRASQQETFVVSMDWLIDSGQANEFLDPSPYEIGSQSNDSPFVLERCVIAVTPTYPLPEGIDNLDAVRNAIVRLGGGFDFAGDNLGRMTHLCTTQLEVFNRLALIDSVCQYNKELRKQPKSDQKRIKLVRHDWLTRCLASKKKLDEENWLLKATDDGQLKSAHKRHLSVDEVGEDGLNAESNGDDGVEKFTRDGGDGADAVDRDQGARYRKSSDRNSRRQDGPVVGKNLLGKRRR